MQQFFVSVDKPATRVARRSKNLNNHSPTEQHEEKSFRTAELRGLPQCVFMYVCMCVIICLFCGKGATTISG